MKELTAKVLKDEGRFLIGGLGIGAVMFAGSYAMGPMAATLSIPLESVDSNFNQLIERGLQLGIYVGLSSVATTFALVNLVYLITKGYKPGSWMDS